MSWPRVMRCGRRALVAAVRTGWAVRAAQRLRWMVPASLLALAVSAVVTRAAAQDTHLVIVTGLGGDPAYTQTFHEWAERLREGAVEAGVAEERIVWLAEDPERAPERIEGRSTAENLERVMARLAAESGERDRVMLVLIGHGTARGDERASFNLPGPDVSPEDVALWLDAFPTQTVAVVNTAPGSGAFVAPLSAPGRVIITATRTARELNETQFGAFFTEAFRGDEADLDKDGRVSLLEAFRYARREVQRYYEQENLIMVEHPVLEDDGDGVGRMTFGEEERVEEERREDEDPDDGRLAAAFWLTSAAQAAAAQVPDSITDPELRRLYEERAELEQRVAELRARKDQMEAEAYEAALEALLLELAVKNREIREKGGGG